MADGSFAIFYQTIQPDVYTHAESTLAYNDGTWHHAAGILRSGLAELYVDGVLVPQDTTNPIGSVRSSTQTTGGTVASDFVGAIDEVRVYSRALTNQQISVLASGSNVQALASRAVDSDLRKSVIVGASAGSIPGEASASTSGLMSRELSLVGERTGVPQSTSTDKSSLWIVSTSFL